MKHLKTYKIFEDVQTSFNNGDEVMILYKLPGTDKRELVPVKVIERKAGSNSYLVSFRIEGNPYTNHPDAVFKGTDIIGPYTSIQAPLSPSLSGSQPVPTDYNRPGSMSGGGVSNDLNLPNS